MKKTILLVFTVFMAVFHSYSQTSWKGTSSTSWSNSANWTNGVPTASVDAIIGDANFTGNNQPSTSANAVCKNLTIGGVKTTTLTVNNAMTVNGNVLVNNNGTLNHTGSTSTIITVKGNWTNNGVYIGNGNNRSNVTFAGTTQTIGGNSVTTFIRLYINASANVTMLQNINISGSNSRFRLYGRLNPGETPTYKLTTSSSTSFTLYSASLLYVRGTLFSDNYAIGGSTTINSGATVEYASTTRNQTVSSSYTYSTLVLSGGTTKTLTANLPSLSSSNSAYGNITVSTGTTFDLGSYTSNRGTSATGGTFTVAAGATLRIGGTNTFPSNYNTRSVNATSTVEYYGASQTILSLSYGNLVLTGSSGAVTKSTSTTAFTIAGNLTINKGTATTVNFNTTAGITLTGNLSISSGATFTGNSTTTTVAGNIDNSGTFTGGTGTLNMTSIGKTISGSGVFNLNNLTLTDATVTVSGSSSITVAGNLTTTAAGTYTHQSGGTTTLTGTSKTITGSGFNFANLTISSGSRTTSSNINVEGDLTVNGSLTASGGTITLSGTSKTLSGSGTMSLSSVLVNGSITKASSFTINSSLTVNGSLTATAGTATFRSTSALNGTANLFNVTVNATSLTLSSQSNLGIAGTLTITAGTFNVTSSKPNTVTFNSASAQNINGITYDNLVLAGSGTKTASAGVTVNNVLTINTGVTFAAGTFTHNLNGSFVNQGTYTPSTGTVIFAATANATITGATTFNNLTVNVSNGTSITLNNNVTASNVTMTNGLLYTGSNSLTITGTRTGNGLIYGTITHNHAFTSGTAYAFEGPFNTITFTGSQTISSVTVLVEKGAVSSFPNSAAANVKYTISYTGGIGSATATLRAHYEDAWLNGNSEASMVLWSLQSGTWTREGKTSNSTTNNYIEKSGIANLARSWVVSDDANVVRWNGSTSTAWNTAANWSVISGSPSLPPSSNDIVLLGETVATFQPTISTAVSVRSIELKSAQSVTLSISPSGALTVNNLSGSWSANAAHQLLVGDGSLSINGDLTLGANVSGRTISISANTGTISIVGSLIGSTGASVSMTGASLLKVSEDFIPNGINFSAGSGTVDYNGTSSQAVAEVSYYNLRVNKTSGTATGPSNAFTVANQLTVQSGTFDISNTLSIGGDVSISNGATFRTTGDSVKVSGNWTNSGNFVAGVSTVCFNGLTNQQVTASGFHDMCMNKGVSTLTLMGNVSIVGDVLVESGKLVLGTNTLNRVSAGGVFMMAGNAELYVSGADNFPKNFVTYHLDTNSLVQYNGTVSQVVAGGLEYGQLSLENGGSNAKSLNATVQLKGSLTITSGATLSVGANDIFLHGNWINNGTFNSGTGTVFLEGSNKQISGNTSFFGVMVSGSYTVNNNNITINGPFEVDNTGAYYAGSGTHVLYGDLSNSGILFSSGTTTFAGTQVQNISLTNAISSVSTGVVNFNGTVSPVMNSNSVPTFANVNINNTAGITPSEGWVILGAFTVGSGAKFNSGLFTHEFLGAFTNDGIINNTGTLYFAPANAETIALGSGLNDNGTLVFAGSGLVTLSGTPTRLNNLTFSNTNTSGISLPGSWTINGSLTIDAGSKVFGGANNYNIGGDLNINGEYVSGSSTITLSSTLGDAFVSDITSLNHLVIAANAIITLNTDVNVLGNFTNNGEVDAASPGAIIMMGDVNATIGGTATDLPNLTIEKTGSTVTLGNSLTGVLLLSINSGTLATSTFTISEDAGGGMLFVQDNAKLKLEGTNGLPTFTTTSLDTLSTVEFAGSTQAITNGSTTTYGNLVISTSGTKTAASNVVINSNFSLTNGTFATGSNSVTLKGNWVMTSGSYTTTSSLTLNGTGNQVLQSTGALRSLIVNKTSGAVYDSSDITITAGLTLTNGQVYTGSYKINLATTTAPTRTNGYVVGRLQRLIPTSGSSASYTFDLGDVDGYRPVAITVSAVTKSGNIAVSSISGDNADIANSQLGGTKSVNRRWNISTDSITYTNYSVVFNYLASDIDAGANTSSFYVSRSTNNVWTVLTTGTKTSTSTQATGVTAVGDFVIGELAARVWDGGAGDNLWGSANNWNPNGVPGVGEDAWINSAVTPTINVAVTVDDLKLSNSTSTITLISGSSLTVNGTLFLSAGSIILNGQTLTINGTIDTSGIGTITGSSNSSIVIGGTAGGNAGTLRMTATSPNNRVRNFTLNRTGLGAEVAIGSNGLEVTNTVTVTSGILRANGNLVLISDVTGTARVGQLIAPADIVGDVVVQRFVPAVTRRSRMLSPNTSGFNFSQLKDDLFITGPGGVNNGFDASSSNGSTIYTYQESTTGTRGWKGISNINATLSPGLGALVFVRGDRSLPAPQWYTPPFVQQNQVTIDFVGPINKGNISPVVTYTNTGNSGDDGWNMLGNPYPSPIDWSSVTKSNVGAFYYVLNPASNSYIANNGAVNIASGQAFFVQAIGANPSVTFTESSKVSTNANGNFKTTTPPLEIEVRKDSLNADLAWLMVDANATPAYNAMEDAIKFTNATINMSFITNDSVAVQYNRTPSLKAIDTFALSMQAPNGTYTITVNNLAGLPQNNGVYLLDKATQTSINLSSTNAYTFSITSANSSLVNRFAIVLVNNNPLPVKLTSFRGEKQGAKHVLNWSTASEWNSKGFYIERSSDVSEEWETIGFVQSKGKSTTTTYTFVDEDSRLTTWKTTYYRLKQVDVNGTVEYSKTIAISKTDAAVSTISLYPNPATTYVDLNLVGTTDGEQASVKVWTSEGVEVMNRKHELNKGNNVFTYTGLNELEKGVYLVEINIGGVTQTQKLVIK